MKIHSEYDDGPLGKVVIDDHHIVQLVNIRKIVPKEAHDMLFHAVPWCSYGVMILDSERRMFR